jgi:hypothetical protein
MYAPYLPLLDDLLADFSVNAARLCVLVDASVNLNMHNRATEALCSYKVRWWTETPRQTRTWKWCCTCVDLTMLFVSRM